MHIQYIPLLQMLPKSCSSVQSSVPRVSWSDNFSLTDLIQRQNCWEGFKDLIRKLIVGRIEIKISMQTKFKLVVIALLLETGSTITKLSKSKADQCNCGAFSKIFYTNICVGSFQRSYLRDIFIF
jgi:hypothetical protein